MCILFSWDLVRYSHLGAFEHAYFVCNIHYLRTNKRLYSTSNQLRDREYVSSIKHLLDLEDTLVLGDLNAHSDLWYSELDKTPRERDIAAEILASQSCAITKICPHRLDPFHDTSSLPDVSICSNSFITSTDWEVALALGIVTTRLSTSQSTKVTRTESDNRWYNKADWENLTNLSAYSVQPSSVHVAEKRFRSIMTKARCRAVSFPMVVFQQFDITFLQLQPSCRTWSTQVFGFQKS